MKILFLIPYPLGRVPSQRFRFEQYFSLLRDRNIHFKTRCFFSKRDYKLLSDKDRGKIIFLIYGFLKRFVTLFEAPVYDFVFIHREAAPVGPPVFEWFITKILRKKIIYDFDDAIWLTDRLQEPKIEKWWRHRNKVASISKWASKVSCGNKYLGEYARRHNSNTIIVPTTVDTENYHNPGLYESTKEPSQKLLTIGWTGSRSTLKYLDEIMPVIRNLSESHMFRFLVIADHDPAYDLKHFCFLPWQKQTEIKDLLEFDIGIMPLPDDPWTQGKCGFKALQYMALCIPTVVSAVGVNKDIIDHGLNGFLCQSEEEWIATLGKLISEAGLRTRIGKAGREKVVDQYSVKANRENFLSLFT